MAQIKTTVGETQAVVQYERDKYAMLFTEKLIKNDEGFWVENFDPERVVTCVDLDRAAINHLIRSLREARDKVFGKDE